MFGIGEDPFQGQGPPGMEGGPLAGLQDQVAAVLNADGNGPRVYVPGGPGQAIFQVTNPQYWGTPPVGSRAGQPTGSRGWAGVVFLLVLAVLVVIALA
jgi:hypothetical protein